MQVLHRRLDGAQSRGVHRVAGVAHDDKLNQSPAEQQLGRKTAVGARHEHGHGVLLARDLDAALAVDGAVLGPVVHVLVVAALEQVERLVRGECGCGPYGLGREGAPPCRGGQRRLDGAEAREPEDVASASPGQLMNSVGTT